MLRHNGPVHRPRRVAVTGLVAVVAATAITTLAAVLTRTAGVSFAIRDGAEVIPLSGITFMTGVFSVLGVGLAATLLRWSARPAERFGRIAVTLTAISLVPPFLAGADIATALALAGLHVVAAAVMIPTLIRSL